MAERRMFAKTIIDSDSFLDMPMSTQALYFHLSMRADDEGFVNNPKKIQRVVGATEDDLKLLIAKNFILTFESGVIVIKHWKIHNYIRADRLVKTKYEEERNMITTKDNGAYTFVGSEEIEAENKDLRKLAYSESSLPYSFNYKIRRAFEGKKCPICNRTMTASSKILTPTVQHNTPISQGGEHELDNISVICLSCNTSIQDQKTGDLNQKEVIETWERIVKLEKENKDWFWNLELLETCQSNDSQMSAQDSIGKDSIGKDSIDDVLVMYEENFGTLSSTATETIISLEDEYTPKYVKEAMRRAIINNKKSLAYVKGILKQWKHKSWDEIVNENNKGDRHKWLNREIKAEKSSVELTEEELKYVGIDE